MAREWQCGNAVRAKGGHAWPDGPLWPGGPSVLWQWELCWLPGQVAVAVAFTSEFFATEENDSCSGFSLSRALTLLVGLLSGCAAECCGLQRGATATGPV